MVEKRRSFTFICWGIYLVLLHLKLIRALLIERERESEGSTKSTENAHRPPTVYTLIYVLPTKLTCCLLMWCYALTITKVETINTADVCRPLTWNVLWQSFSTQSTQSSLSAAKTIVLSCVSTQNADMFSCNQHTQQHAVLTRSPFKSKLRLSSCSSRWLFEFQCAKWCVCRASPDLSQAWTKILLSQSKKW